MKVHHSVPDYGSLMRLLNDIYRLNLDDIYLYRDMIGAVYFLREKDHKYVYKLYRHFDTQAAIQSTQILAYLKANNFPVATVVPTKQGKLFSNLEMPEGNRVGILFEFVDGTEPDLEEDIVLIGKLTGRMHRLMEAYDGHLRQLGKEHYIDRFVRLMRKMSYETGKIDQMDKCGAELWNNIRDLPKGFCHGDLHTGNLLKTRDGEIILVDFDIASYSYPIFDVATVCDDTDFTIVKSRDMEKTYYNFERFYKGYREEKELSRAEQSVILDCIAIHHYELNGTIPIYRVPVEGNHWLNDRYFNLHYTWIMDWKEKQKSIRPSKRRSTY